MIVSMRLLWLMALLPVSLFGKPPEVIRVDQYGQATVVVHLPSAFPGLSADQDKAIDVKALGEKYPDYDAVYLERFSDFENVVTTSLTTGYSWNLLHSEYQKVVVFNPNREFYSTLAIKIEKEQELATVSLSIWSPGGRFQQFGLSDMKEARNSDGSATYKFAYPEVIKGSVITQAYVIKQLYCLRNATLHYQIPLQYEIPCEKASFRLAYPYGWEMGIKKIGDDKVLPVHIVKDKKADTNTMSYSAEHVPAMQSEPFAPFYKEVATYAEIQVQKLNMRVAGWYPISYKAPRDWSELSDRFKDYVIDRDAVFSRRMEQKSKELTVDCKTDFEKLDAITTWLQLNMRLVDYSETEAKGLDRGNFAHNLERQEGTVSQVTGLGMSMLQEAGIDSRYLLIHSAKDGFFDPDFYSFSQLDVAGVLARIDGRIYVVLPYRWRMPVDHIPEEFQGQKALAIDRKGHSEFIEIPLGSQSENETSESYNLTFLEDGRIRVEEERTLRGASAYTTRQQLAGLSYRDAEKAVKHMITFSEGKVSLKSHAVIDQQEYKKPLKIKMEYEVENLVVLTPEELFAPLSRVKSKDSAKDRQSPIRVYFDETVKKTITMNFPATWSPGTNLEDFAFENRFGTITGTYGTSPGLLKGEQVLVLRKASEPKEHYPDLQALTGKKTRHSIPAIVFKISR